MNENINNIKKSYIFRLKKFFMKEKIKKIIKKDLSSYRIEKLHCKKMLENIDKYLVEPVEEMYLSGIDKDFSELLWTVLKDIPSEETGYLIYFDPDLNKFGLGVYSSKKDGSKIDIGIYGSFVKTLNSM